MKGIKGQLSSLSITDLMQWIDMNKKSGVLFVETDKSSKCFCFEDGKLLLASSREPERRFGDFLVKEGYIQKEEIKNAISEGQKDGISFISYLLNAKKVPSEFVKVSIEHLAENNIMDILSWDEGSFQFIEELPRLVAKSPIKLGINFITFEAVRKHDEKLREIGLK